MIFIIYYVKLYFQLTKTHYIHSQDSLQQLTLAELSPHWCPGLGSPHPVGLLRAGNVLPECPSRWVLGEAGLLDVGVHHPGPGHLAAATRGIHWGASQQRLDHGWLEEQAQGGCLLGDRSYCELTFQSFTKSLHLGLLVLGPTIGASAGVLPGR